MSNVNIWAGKGIWLKGNIHTHTVNSDGLCTTEEIALEYGRRGYDFVFLTDHDKRVMPGLKIRKPLLIPAEEIDFNFKGYSYHFVCLGLEKTWESKSFHSPMQLLDRAGREGVFVVQAHPYWCGLPSHKCRYRRGLTCPGMEVYNTACDWEIAKGYATVHWDDLLDAGHHILGFAVDDTHQNSHIAGGWIMVKAENRSSAAILTAIRNGNFYSSQGPEISSIKIRGREIKVACSPAMRINFIANRSGGCSLRASAAKLEKAVWDVPRGVAYVRVEIVSGSGKIAWSNPVYFPR